MKRIGLAALTIVIGAAAGGQTITPVSARPANARAAVSFRYGDPLKFAVRTSTSAEAAELRSIQVRIFTGTVQEKLDAGADSAPAIGCHYYESIVIRPVVSRRAPTDTLLDLRRLLGPQWASTEGRPVTRRYTVVFEKVARFALAAGSSKREPFAIKPAAHNTYFGTAVDLIIDPGTLTASDIRLGGAGASALPEPPECPAAMVTPPAIEVADLRPVAVRPPDRLMAAVRPRRGMIERRAR